MYQSEREHVKTAIGILGSLWTEADRIRASEIRIRLDEAMDELKDALGPERAFDGPNTKGPYED